MRSIGPHRVTNLNVVDSGVDELFSDGRKAYNELNTKRLEKTVARLEKAA